MKATCQRFGHGSRLKIHCIPEAEGLLLRYYTILSKAAVAVDADRSEVFTEVFSAVAAVVACPAVDVGVNCHPIPYLEPSHRPAHSHHFASIFMA